MGGHHRGAVEVMAEQVTGRSPRGVVAAAAPLAAALGAEVMRAGGNAYDGAVTAALAETVLLPPKCGLGGDLVALRLRAGAAEPEALIAVGPAAAGLARAVQRNGSLPQTGPLSVGPPAAGAGYAELAAAASRSLADLAAPAIALAEDGFAWSTICTWLTEESLALLRTHQPDGCAYLPRGRPPEPGEVVRLPGLAHALRALAADGAGYLRGPVGEAIVNRVARAGGVLTLDDLGSVRAEWRHASSAEVGGWRLWATPAPTHGPALLDTLASAAGRSDPVALWLAFQQATERRRQLLGDQTDGGTSMVSAVDALGEAVIVVHSNSFPQFGSGLVVPEYDLILNNRAGRGFTPVEGHPNAPAAGRRPATTLHAWAAGTEGRVRFLGGTPGGANQVSWNAQLLAALLAGERDPGRLVSAPRWEWLPATDGLVIEEGVDDDVAAELGRLAPGGASRVDRWALRCAQQVVALPGERPPAAAADPRTVGAVAPV